MDDERAKIASDELERVLERYDVGTLRAARSYHRGSHRAPKLILHTEQGSYLLKRRAPDNGIHRQIAFSHALQRFLADRHFPLPHLIATRSGETALHLEGATYELFEFIEGSRYDRSLEATAEAGKTLGLYHRLVGRFQTDWHPPSGHYHDSGAVHRSFEELERRLVPRRPDDGHKKQNGAPPSEDVTAVLRRLKSSYQSAAEDVNALGLTDWETQIVHADWHPGNLLFDGPRVVAVLDYDAARIQPRVVDVANGCLQFSMVSGGRDLSRWDDHTDSQRAAYFLGWYDEMNSLTRAELRAVPPLMREVLIAQTIPPILRTGTFAGLDAFEFLKIVDRKSAWLAENAERFHVEEPARVRQGERT